MKLVYSLALLIAFDARIRSLILRLRIDASLLDYNCTDRFTQHRYKADQAFLLNKDKAPVAAYLDIDHIVKICRDNGVEGELRLMYYEVTIARLLSSMMYPIIA